MQDRAEIGIIGGSGLYELAGLDRTREISVSTPFGPPSASYRLGEIERRRVAFLPRHGRPHRLSPSLINYRANLFGFKALGVERIVSVSAVGSLKETIAPRDLVLPDQFIDRTQRRSSTFFEDGIVAHVSLADPICLELAGALAGSGGRIGIRVHRGGTYVCIEGPQFSTRAESRLYQGWGASIIGMTNLTEARLAREAEICYATLAVVTDYDSWREGDSVEVSDLLRNLGAGVEHAARIIRDAVPRLEPTRACACRLALANALLTPDEAIPRETLDRLAPLLPERLRRPGRGGEA
jgi:5'-methylthioadenosine phosphorylase